MSTFLKLTVSFTNEKIRININKILTYEASLDRSPDKDGLVIIGSYIKTSCGNHIMVREKPEEIDRLLRDSYITIKESYENRIGEIPQHPTNSSIDGSTQSQS